PRRRHAGTPARDRPDAGHAPPRTAHPAGRRAGGVHQPVQAAGARQTRARGRPLHRDRLRRLLPAAPDRPGRRRLPAPAARPRPRCPLRVGGGAVGAGDLGPRPPRSPSPAQPRRARPAARAHRRGRRRGGGPVNVAEVAARANGLVDQVERAVVGKRDALELVLLGLLADGHVLIEDFPGLAKTLIARSFAQATGLGFGRIQFTPDLMPSDVTGSSVYNQRTADFEFRPGPIFTNLLLADEINRAPPKTQAALLEAMQEHQVTSEGLTRLLERPFLVLATQNPIEHEGTYPLPEAQLDRFLLRISVGYPSREHELGILEQRRDRRVDEVVL